MAEYSVGEGLGQRMNGWTLKREPKVEFYVSEKVTWDDPVVETHVVDYDDLLIQPRSNCPSTRQLEIQALDLEADRRTPRAEVPHHHTASHDLTPAHVLCTPFRTPVHGRYLSVFLQKRW